MKKMRPSLKSQKIDYFDVTDKEVLAQASLLNFSDNTSSLEPSPVVSHLLSLFPFPPHSFVEWWCSSISPFSDRAEDFATGIRYALPPHVDKDEREYFESGKIVTPLAGGVFYYFDGPVEGGELEIEDQLFAPVSGRLLVFDVTKLHAVREVKSGVRNALTFNLWNKKICTAPSYSDPSV